VDCDRRGIECDQPGPFHRPPDFAASLLSTLFWSRHFLTSFQEFQAYARRCHTQFSATRLLIEEIASYSKLSLDVATGYSGAPGSLPLQLAHYPFELTQVHASLSVLIFMAFPRLLACHGHPWDSPPTTAGRNQTPSQILDLSSGRDLHALRPEV